LLLLLHTHYLHPHTHNLQMRRVSPGNNLAWFLLWALALAATVSCVTSPMPYRPGYGLGSWLPPDVMDGMKREAHSRSAILLAGQLDNDATSLARELQIAERPIQNPLNSQQDIAVPLDEKTYKDYMGQINNLRRDAWAAKVSSYTVLLNQMQKDIKTLQDAAQGQNPQGIGKVFSTFASDVESPVDWATSKIDLVDRAYDSIAVGSHFLDTDTIRQMSRDSSWNSTQGFNASSSEQAKNDLGKLLNTGTLSTQMNQAVSEKLQQTYSIQAVESTLILSSFATHRKVKQFTTLNTDADRLREAWNYFKPQSPIPHPYFQHDEFGAAFADLTQADLQTNLDRIALVTEIFQGSALVGFVHFIRVESTQSSQTMSSSDYMAATASLKVTNFVDTATGGTSFTRDTATTIANMASSSGLDIQFDIVCMGYVPKLGSTDLQSAVSDMLKMDVSDQTASADGAKGQTQQQSNAQALIDGLVHSLNSVARTNPVLGVQTFMNAFNDYATAATEKPDGMGAPVGMNVKTYSKIDVLTALSSKYFGVGLPTGTSAAAQQQNRQNNQQ